MNLNTLNDIASELFAALREQKTIQPLTDKYPEIDINDAYKISKKFLSLRAVSYTHLTLPTKA